MVSMDGKKTPRFVWLILVAWALAVAISFVVFAVIEPSGSGFTRGANRAGSFLGWQAAAMLLAMLLWMRVRRIGLPLWQRRLLSLPWYLHVLLLLGFCAFVAWGVFAGGSGV